MSVFLPLTLIQVVWVVYRMTALRTDIWDNVRFVLMYGSLSAEAPRTSQPCWAYAQYSLIRRDKQGALKPLCIKAFRGWGVSRPVSV